MINSTSTESQKARQHACAAAPSASSAARREALYLTLTQVPAGTLISYGQLAALAGLGRAARWVGRTLSQLPADSSLPWHRVIAASGRFSLPADSPAGAEQRARLHAEGIDLTNDRVNLRIHGWRP